MSIFKNNYPIYLVSIIILLSLTTSCSESLKYDYYHYLHKRYIIYKDYCGLKVEKYCGGDPRCKIKKEGTTCDRSSIDEKVNIGVRYYCRMSYLEKEDYSNRNEYHVSVTVYYTSKSVKTDMCRTLQAIALENMGDISYLQNFYNKDRLITYQKGNNNIVGITWIHQNKKISLNVMNETYYLCNEIINDYLDKYPPTVTFRPEDLAPETVIKDMIAKRMKQIEELDNKREGAPPNVTSVWQLRDLDTLIEECSAEMHVRCMIGLLDPDGKVRCHYTEIYDDAARKPKLAELKKAAQTTPPIQNNFSFSVPHATVCPMDGYLKKMKLDEKKIFGDK